MQPKLHPQQTKLRDKRKETNPMQLSLWCIKSNQPRKKPLHNV